MRFLLVLLLSGLASLAAEDMIRVPAGGYDVTDAITTVRARVRVDAFLLGATEVTQADYEAVTGGNPSFYKGASRPVENVSWLDVLRYCNLRSAREKLRACYTADGKRVEGCDGYRLPTEAEWLVAAGRAPAATDPAVLGDSSTKSMAVFDAPLARGTMPVRSVAPNAAGLFDMWGNVWEWCEDFFSVRPSPDTVHNPRGPSDGLARVIRGGSFVSTRSRWSRDHRSSMNADTRSRFTGFRVARSLPPAASEQVARPDVNKPPAGFESGTGWLKPVDPAGLPAIRQKWEALLAAPKLPAGAPRARLVRQVEQRNFRGEITELELEPGIWEKVYVLRPAASWSGPRPVLLVPFYDIDTPAAADLNGRVYSADRGVNGFAYTAAQHGYVAVAVRWFGESYGESYSEAVANLALRHPGATGLGKWVADARRVVDWVVTLPGIDASRVGIMGHSLGGKMALYAGAFDDRIKAVVSSELGVGFRFSNYEDYWYFGDKLAQAPAGMDQHELIALTAPRPFLLIGGDEYDKAESWYYIHAARPAYASKGVPENVGYFNHHKGHTPSAEAVAIAFDWLDSFLRP